MNGGSQHGRATTLTPPNWSKEMAEQANKRWLEFWQWAEDAGLPTPFSEALLRDMLASIEGRRMAHVLQAYIPALRGPQQ